MHGDEKRPASHQSSAPVGAPIPATSPRPAGRIQRCYSPDAYVTASLDEVEIGTYGICESRIGAMAYRKFNEYPVVLIHVEGFKGGIDAELLLTKDEARELAQHLLTAAEAVDNP